LGNSFRVLVRFQMDLC